MTAEALAYFPTKEELIAAIEGAPSPHAGPAPVGAFVNDRIIFDRVQGAGKFPRSQQHVARLDRVYPIGLDVMQRRQARGLTTERRDAAFGWHSPPCIGRLLPLDRQWHPQPGHPRRRNAAGSHEEEIARGCAGLLLRPY